MKRIEAVNFVIKNARYMGDAPQKPYFVRFPFPYSSGKIFFSADTEDLVEQVFNFGKTKEGRELWSKTEVGEYLELEEDYGEDEEEEDYEMAT